MDTKKRKRLEAAGWRVGSVKELLDLTDAESALIEMHLRLIDEIKRRLARRAMSQADLARELGTSASRLSNMLSGREVSADALMRALLVLGATSKEVGRVVSGTRTRSFKKAAAEILEKNRELYGRLA